MDLVNTLRRNGLFDAKVPRYTSYPPANRFVAGIGARHQLDWMANVPGNEPVSVYVHIPFCRRLCWFCACRTQGTKTLAPVDAYLDRLVQEIDTVGAQALPQGIKMERLHLGGGTPTLLSGPQMSRLLDCVFACFDVVPGFEFSVEIDPTEASEEVLDVLLARGMKRASIGVQDFAPKVQAAIGRKQSFEDTQKIVSYLRCKGLEGLNVDFLYGLPHQTADSLARTIDQVVSLRPDRLALYGYAHVPHVSKRQVMIPDEALPGAEGRFVMSQIARARLEAFGYLALGIDHFALAHDGLAKAAGAGTMSRNFQGYTDDPCETLIGFGASAISKLPQGYVQNAVATSAYAKRVEDSGLAGHRGFELTHQDQFIAALVDRVMCIGAIRFEAIKDRFPDRSHDLAQLVDRIVGMYPELVELDRDALKIKEGYMACARLIAGQLDQTGVEPNHHSLAV